MTTRRNAIKTGAATLGVAGSGLSGCNWLKPAKSKLLESAYIPILDSIPLLVAYAKGFFDEVGVKAAKPVLMRGWEPLLESFVSKQVQLTHIFLPQHIFLRYVRNVPVRSIACTHANFVTILISDRSDSILDLGGEVVGCPTWWAPHTGLFQDVLRSAGLTPVVGKEKPDLMPNEVAFRIVAPPKMAEALRNGSIAGCTVSELFGVAAKNLSHSKLIRMSGDVLRGHPCSQSVLLQDTIDEDPAWAEAITTALYKATNWANNNPKELARILGNDGGGYFPLPVLIIERAISQYGMERYDSKGIGAIRQTVRNAQRPGFTPFQQSSAFEANLALMRRTVVDPILSLPASLANLKGHQLALELVDFKLAEKGFLSA